MNDRSECKWKVLSSCYVSRAPWLTVRKECVELPNGNQVPEYYVLEYPEWVNILALTCDRRIVMVRQYRHALGEFGWELPAGVSEKSDASIEAAARRELAEETGYGGGEWSEYMTISANPATHSNLTHVFLARGVEKLGRQQLDATEDLSFAALPIAEVRAMLERGEIVQSLMAAPLWKFFARGDEFNQKA